MPIKLCLLNTRSTNKKELILKDFTAENDIDIFAVTETWLRDDNAFFPLLKSVLKGGGLLKENILMKTQPQRQFTSFKYIDVTVNCSNSSTRMAII